jgi:type I restriction enzyme, S subunit
MNDKSSNAAFADSWAWSRFSEIGLIINGDRGKNYPSRRHYVEEGIPFITAGHLSDGKLSFTAMNYITESKFAALNNGKLLPGDIIYCLRGTLGKCAIYIDDKRAAIASSLAILRLSSVLNKKLVYYYLQSPFGKELIKKHDNGTAQPNLSAESFGSFTIPIPPHPEQNRIVAKIEELFSELDKGVEALKTAQQQLKVYRQAVLQRAFEGKLTEEWRKQKKDLPTASQLLKQIKTEREKEEKATGKKLKPTVPLMEAELVELPALPQEWCWVKIKDIASNAEYGTSSKSKKSGKIVVLRMGNIQNCRIRWDDLQYTDNEEEIKKYRLKRNDVLFNRTNSPDLVGKTAIYKGEVPAIFAGYLIRVNQFSALAEADYLNYFLNSYVAKQHGNSVKTDGVNQSNINGTRLGKYPFPYCSSTEQRQIVQEIESRLSVADKIEESIAQSLKQAEALRQSILKKAFEGKLVPQDPNDEPAEKLMARIRAERAAQTPLRSRRRPGSRPEALKRGPLV